MSELLTNQHSTFRKMKRTLILDSEGNAVVTCNEDFNCVTFLVGEIWVRGELIPGKKIQINGINHLKSLRDYLSGVVQSEEEIIKLKQEKKELSKIHIQKPTEESSKKLKEINFKISKLREIYFEDETDKEKRILL